MSETVPQTQDGLLDWYAQHQPVWESDFAAVGLTMAQTDVLKGLVDAATIKRAARNNARQQSKSATLGFNQSLTALGTYGGALMATIRAYAEATNNPDVYEKADIPAPKPATPAPPPQAPEDFTADPNADGTITLRWRGSVSQNGSFDIERSIDGGPYIFVKNARAKTWMDHAVPMNTNMIVYRGYGVRDAVRSGTSASTTVIFGNLPAALAAAFRTGPVAEAA